MWSDSAIPRRVALTREPAAVSMQAWVTVTLWWTVHRFSRRQAAPPFVSTSHPIKE
jgi:hypothetical protein